MSASEDELVEVDERPLSDRLEGIITAAEPSLQEDEMATLGEAAALLREIEGWSGNSEPFDPAMQAICDELSELSPGEDHVTYADAVQALQYLERAQYHISDGER